MNSDANVDHSFLRVSSNFLDVEEILSSRAIARKEIFCDKRITQRLRNILENDIKVVILPNSSFPGLNFIHDIDENTPLQIQDFIDHYASSIVFIQQKLYNFSFLSLCLEISRRRPKIADSLRQHFFETDLLIESDSECMRQIKRWQRGGNKNNCDLERFLTITNKSSYLNVSKDRIFADVFQSFQNDAIINDVLQLPQQFENKRLCNENLLITLYPLLNEAMLSEKIKLAVSNVGIKRSLCLKILKLSISPCFEPIFACVSLYDIRLRQKTSENFYFEFNSVEMCNFLKKILPSLLNKEKCRNALFALEGFNLSSLYLVFRIQKVFEGNDISDCIDYYAKENKYREKLMQLSKENCKRLGAYHTPFGWMALKLSSILKKSKIVNSSIAISNSAIKVSADDEFRFSTNSSINFETTIDNDDVSIISSDLPSVTESCLSKIRTSSSFNQNREINGEIEVINQNIQKIKNFTNKLPNEEQREINLETVNPTVININSFYKEDHDRLTDEELIDFLISRRKCNSTRSSRIKTFPVDLEFEISVVNFDKIHDSAIIISPELTEICKKSNNKNLRKNLTVYKDILLFPRLGSFLVNTSYRNLLFIYPKSINLSSKTGNYRNICIKIQLMNKQMVPVPAIYEKFGSSDFMFLTEFKCGITYHSKTPQFMDEIKIQLPSNLDDGHHILFTFIHISCKHRKSSQVNETPIGYTWFPLLKNNEIQVGNFSLPVSMDILPAGIFYLSPLLNVPNVKWYDAHKNLFDVSFNLVSTVYTQDHHLHTFFCAHNSLRLQSKRSNVVLNPYKTITEIELKNYILCIMKVRPEPMVSFLYIILNKLLDLMIFPPFSEEITKCCFNTMCQLVKVGTMLLDGGNVDEYGRSNLFLSYVYYHQITPKGCFKNQNNAKMFNAIPKCNKNFVPNNEKFVFEEIMNHFSMSHGTIRETACIYSWFFFELTLKAMTEYLSACDYFFLPRKLRFRDSFLNYLTEVVKILTDEIIDRCSKDIGHAKMLNTSLAFFLRDALLLMDRTFVFKQIKYYNDNMVQKINCSSSDTIRSSLLIQKISFLQINCSHEHFLFLNLPFENTALPAMKAIDFFETNYDLNNDYMRTHFLLGIVLSDLSTLLSLPKHKFVTTLKCCKMIINLIRTIFLAHENDTRLVTDIALRNRVATLYLPLIGIIINSRTRLFDYKNQCIRFAGSKFCQYENNYTKSKLDHESHNIASISNKLSKECSKELLICLCWIVNNIDKSTFLCYLKTRSSIDFVYFVEILQLCTSLLEFRPISLEDVVSCKSNNENDDFNASNLDFICWRSSFSNAALVLFYNHGKHFIDRILENNYLDYYYYMNYKTCIKRCDKIKNLKDLQFSNESTLIKWRSNERLIATSYTKKLTEIKGEEVDLVFERQLSTEVNLSVVYTIDTIIKLIVSNDRFYFILPNIILLLVHMMSCNQSIEALEHIFCSVRRVIAYFPELIFEQKPELCNELCLQVLKHMASRFFVIRSHAAGILYLLLRNCFILSNSFSRLKIQTIVALSSLLSTFFLHEDVALLNDCCLRQSFKSVLSYLESDFIDTSKKVCNNYLNDNLLAKFDFSCQIKDFVYNLNMILSNTVKINVFLNDYETLVDLMCQVAKGYRYNPDLRIIWLINISNKHVERENFMEAAHCLLHCVALIVEHLSMLRNKTLYNSLFDFLPQSIDDFDAFSGNLCEEYVVFNDSLGSDEDEICQSFYFSIDGFIQLFDNCIIFFQKAQAFELLEPLYKFIMPILEQKRDYDRLKQIHQWLSFNLKKIEQPLQIYENISDGFSSSISCIDKRCFGTYYRVGFYGSKFEDLNGKEFIYKEPSITKLSEISQRLESYYAEKFGGKIFIEVIKDSNYVNLNLLNHSKAYIQITFVEPFFDLWEQRRRYLYFEKNYKLNCFVYATPFTTDGKAHGLLREQFKRRTILTTKHYFPYTKTRVRIIDQRQDILTPIQVAIEDIEKKTRQLTETIALQPPDTKMLQMILQGCIGVTVNVGPLEMRVKFKINIHYVIIHLKKEFCNINIKIAKVFLSSDCNKSKPACNAQEKQKFQNILRLCFKDFSKKCEQALLLNASIIEPERRDYQNELQKNYDDFKLQLTEILMFKKIKLSDEENENNIISLNNLSFDKKLNVL